MTQIGHGRWPKGSSSDPRQWNRASLLRSHADGPFPVSRKPPPPRWDYYGTSLGILWARETAIGQDFGLKLIEYPFVTEKACPRPQRLAISTHMGGVTG